MPRRSHRTRTAAFFLLILLLLVVFARPPRQACHANGPGAVAGALGGWLTAALEEVPCPDSGRVVYDARDNLDAPMDALDPIDDPAGGYLGVYHVPGRPLARGQLNYEVVLAHSDDLIDWTRVRVLDPVGASMPTLAAIPGTPGYLLAYEKSTGKVDYIRLVYYSSLATLLKGQVDATVGLPLRFSSLANGTPSFVSIDWAGGLDHSVIQLAFHYEAPTSRGLTGPDREATGTLYGFRRWQARRDTATDAALVKLGLAGSHGDRRQFSFDGTQWRVYEAQLQLGNFATWHLLLYDVATRQFEPLELALADGHFGTSFGNPIATVLRSPTGRGQVLAVTVFVFGSGAAAREAGELVYYQPIT